MFEFLFSFFTNVIHTLGYSGIFILMICESMILPVPSEAVMPFAGYLVQQHQFTMFFVVLYSSIGTIVGSLISYTMGYLGGKPFILKVGKYLLLNKHHLDMTERFFDRHGKLTIFVSRFIPVIRHLISIPAGTGRMNLVSFIVFTIIGGTLWNTFLAYFGFYLGKNWHIIHDYSRYLDILVVLICLGYMAYFIKKKWRKRRLS